MEWELLPLPLFLMISILLNSVIAVAGVIPSAFLTAINVSVLGLVPGILVSIVGEAVGAVVSFILYRKALHRYVSPNGSRFQRLRESEGTEAWFLVLGMRLMPFVPSGLVTLSAAFSRMTLASFAVASTIGKICLGHGRTGGDGSDAVNDWMAAVFSWCRRHDVSFVANASKKWRENVTKRFDETFAGRLFPQHGPID
ncbi:VTT domain-containing protein [Exiguobacterium sp. N5]|uniref:TVP38/TMEM64 family protein n=1 Tax=Exiguobacterium sp. N5 TaxID=2990450 RepID=UPI0021F4FB50|nr:VTT domain-containing protein [Exiguobacterium sp. N5]MCV9900399.1 VTT domain-containing protein [Exiguobacterium sp. N5]